MKSVFPRTILHITHPWGGGIQSYLDDMVRMFGTKCRIYSLFSDRGALHVVNTAKGTRRSYRFGSAVRLTDYYRSDYRHLLEDLIESLDVDLIHLNSMLGHTYDLVKVSHERGIPLVCTVHDYYFVCPTFHMVTTEGVFCEGCARGQIDTTCLARNEYLSYADFDLPLLAKWRDEFRQVIPLFDLFVFPSAAAKTLFEEYYPEVTAKAEVIMHGDSLPESVVSCNVSRRGLRVGVIGSLWKHKGRAMIEYLVGQNKDDEIAFVHFGDNAIPAENMIKLGRYEQSRIISLLREQGVDLLLILSTWPETFSYTLSEAFKAEIPVIVTNLGATRERVESTGGGWVVDYQQPQQVLDLLGRLKQNRQEIDAKKALLATLPKTTLTEMERLYTDAYARISGRRPLRKNRAAAVRIRLVWRRLSQWVHAIRKTR